VLVLLRKKDGIIYLLGTVGSTSFRCKRSVDCNGKSEKGPTVILTEDGRFSCVVKADDNDTHLIISHQAAENLREHKAHYDYIL
jgi:hypothetical protein